MPTYFYCTRRQRYVQSPRYNHHPAVVHLAGHNQGGGEKIEKKKKLKIKKKTKEQEAGGGGRGNITESRKERRVCLERKKGEDK